jgi:hypothetical protein
VILITYCFNDYSIRRMFFFLCFLKRLLRMGRDVSFNCTSPINASIYISKCRQMQAQSDHVNRSDLVKRFFTVRWRRESQRSRKGHGLNTPWWALAQPNQLGPFGPFRLEVEE